MPSALDKCLHDLERRIDDAREQRNRDQWRAFLDEELECDIFRPARDAAVQPTVEWPAVSVNQAQEDFDAMAIQQFAAVSGVLASGGGARLNVRCNYGTGILPSLFGCELFMMDEALNTLPTARPLGSRDRMAELLDAGVPDVRGGLGAKVFEMAERFLGIFDRYPKIGRNVRLYHPDVQGPIDVLEVVWGSSMFYAFYEDTPLLRDCLELVTATYTTFMRKWYELVPPDGEYSAHWGLTHKGRLMLRNDSLMNLSPEAYVEYVRPMDQRLFDAFGGAGGIHFCGRGDHYIEAMSEMRGLSAIAMSQPHLNDMETIYRNTVDKGIKLIGFSREVAESAGRPLHGRVQC